MRNPDSLAFERCQQVMMSGQMVGSERPVGRITIGKNKLVNHTGNSNIGLVHDILFGQPIGATEREFLGVVKSINISRSIDDDAASCTIVLYNEGNHLSSAPMGLDTMGRPGYWGPNRREKNTTSEASTYQHIVHQVGEADADSNYDTPELILERIKQIRSNRSLAPDDAMDEYWRDEIVAERTTIGFARTEYDRMAAELLGYENWPIDWKYSSPSAYNSPSNSENGDSTQYPTSYLNELMLPNRVIRTYQGYGSQNVDDLQEQLMPDDPGYVPPWEDEYLLQTGVWMVDRVSVDSEGMITVECTDTAKLLIKQFVYPPMLPLNRFPLTYCPIVPEEGDKGGVGKNVATGYHSSSNDVHYGKNATLFGHSPSHAFDGKASSYWLSVGNAGPTRDFAFEWMQTATGGNSVNEVVINVKGSYTCFVSVMENGSWQGDKDVPYNPNAQPAFPNGANIKYVKRYTVGNGSTVLKLPRTYEAQHVRVCFANLWDSGLGPYRYRAALRDFKVRWNRPDTYKPSNKGETGAIGSWTDAVKELLAWGGFTWYADPAKGPTVPADPLLGNDRSTGVPLRVWGDFEITPAPKSCSEPEQFLNKSFMEAINVIREWLGCIFYVDESGAAIFRLPNIYSGGNYIHDPDYSQSRVKIDREWPIEFHENANLIDYGLVFDDSALRSEILVVGGTPDLTGETIADAPILGGVLLQSGVPGINGVNAEDVATAPTTGIDFSKILSGQYRLMVAPADDTKGFSEYGEAQRMAELTALFLLFTYRRGEVTSPAHPGLQLDDQVRIFNRITNEFNVQYVSGITTDMDLDTGLYTMNCSVHWLGGDPDTNWFFERFNLTPAMKNYPAILQAIGTSGSDRQVRI